MANFFDQFDAPPQPAGNFFDQFDGPAPVAGGNVFDKLSEQLASAVPAVAEVLPSSGVPVPQRPEQDTRSVYDYFSDVAGSTADGLRQGVSNMLGAPVELINMSPMLMNVLPGEQGFQPFSERPVGGSKDFDEALRFGNSRVADPLVPDYKPQTTAGRFANRIGEEVGATAVPLVGGLSAAQRLGREGVKDLGPVARSFVEPMVSRPDRVAGRELSYALASGAGAQALNEIVTPEGNGTWWSDVIGSVGGMGALGVGKAITGLARNSYAAATGKTRAFDDVAGRAVTDRLVDNSTQMQNIAAEGGSLDTTRLAQSLATPSAAEAAVPGFRANIADRTADAGLSTLAFNTDAAIPGAANARRTANAAAVDARLADLAPEGNPAALRAGLEQGAQSRIADATSSATDATRAFDDAFDALRPQRGPVDRGYALRTALQGRNDAELQRIAEMYGTLDASLPADYSLLSQRFDEVTNNLPLNDARRFAPAEVDTVRQLVPEGGDAVLPLKQAMSIRTGLADTLTDGAAGNQQRRVAGLYQDEVNDFIRSALPEEQAKLLDQARADRLDVGRRFEDKGAIPEILNKTGRKQYDMPNEMVAGRAVSGPTDYQAVMREVGNDPTARRAVADQIAADAIERDAIRSPEALAKFVQERNFALNDFPEVRNALERAGASKQTMQAAQEAAKQTTRDMSPGGPTATGQYLRYDDTGTRQAIGTAWKSAQPEKAVRELLEVAGDTPDTRRAAKAALWTEVSGTGKLDAPTMTSADGVQRWSGRKLDKLFKDERFAKTADVLWEDNPEHLADIRGVVDALAGADGSVQARAVGSSGTAQSLSGKYDASMTATGIASRARSVHRGQLSPTIAVVDVLSTALRNRSAKVQSRAIDELMARAINDPDLAADLLRRFNPADEAAENRAFLTRFGVRLPTVANVLSGTDDDNDDTFDRTMGAK